VPVSGGRGKGDSKQPGCESVPVDNGGPAGHPRRDRQQG